MNLQIKLGAPPSLHQRADAAADSIGGGVTNTPPFFFSFLLIDIDLLASTVIPANLLLKDKYCHLGLAVYIGS
jgi:hypothetical protein